MPLARWKRVLIGAGIGAVAAALAGGLLYSYLFGPLAPKDIQTTQFLVNPDEDLRDLATSLKREGYVRSALVFELAYLLESEHGAEVRPGGYTLGKGMDTWTIATTLARPPALGWVTIPQGVRKEQIAAILQETLFWTDAQKEAWLAATNTGGMSEGVFYPDVYLIASDQDPAEIVARMRARFTDHTAELAKEAAAKRLDWADVLTFASIIEREAAKNDKRLVAGILWNRLNRGMLLQADATMQYAKGEEGSWWSAPTSEDKYIESPYNTYRNEGLPPGPIATPSLASIDAVLNPEKTSCLYYLHDTNGRIHCSANYAGQVQNVNRYLK